MKEGGVVGLSQPKINQTSCFSYLSWTQQPFKLRPMRVFGPSPDSSMDYHGLAGMG